MKQWRWARTKIRHLLALGRGPRLKLRLRGLGRSEGAEVCDAAACKADLKSAIQHGVSRQRYWHIARTPAVQQALSNAWLKAQGLVSVKDLWCKAQGYMT